MSNFDIWAEEPKVGVGPVRLAQDVEAETFANAVEKWWKSDSPKPEGFTLLHEKLALYDKESGEAVLLHESEKDAATANKEALLLRVSLKGGMLEVNVAKDTAWDADMMLLFSNGLSKAVTKVNNTGAVASAILAAAVGIVEEISGRAYADKVVRDINAAVDASSAFMTMLHPTVEQKEN